MTKCKGIRTKLFEKLFTPIEVFNFINYFRIKGENCGSFIAMSLFRTPEYIFENTKHISN